jgi:hypothetical protein
LHPCRSFPWSEQENNANARTVGRGGAKGQATQASPFATDNDVQAADSRPAPQAAPFARDVYNNQLPVPVPQKKVVGAKPVTSDAKIGNFDDQQSKENYEHQRLAAQAVKDRNRGGGGIFG